MSYIHDLLHAIHGYVDHANLVAHLYATARLLKLKVRIAPILVIGLCQLKHVVIKLFRLQLAAKYQIVIEYAESSLVPIIYHFLVNGRRVGLGVRGSRRLGDRATSRHRIHNADGRHRASDIAASSGAARQRNIGQIGVGVHWTRPWPCSDHRWATNR